MKSNSGIQTYQIYRFNRELLPLPSDYYRQQGIELYGTGEWQQAHCPFHEDRSPSFRVHRDSGGFICHGCGKRGGDVLSFHQALYGISFQEAAIALGAMESAAFTPEIQQQISERKHAQYREVYWEEWLVLRITRRDFESDKSLSNEAIRRAKLARERMKIITNLCGGIP